VTALSTFSFANALRRSGAISAWNPLYADMKTCAFLYRRNQDRIIAIANLVYWARQRSLLQQAFWA